MLYWMLLFVVSGVAGYFFLRSATAPIIVYFDAHKMLSVKPALIKDGKLYMFENFLRIGKPVSVFYIEDAPQYPFKSGFFTKPCYLCYYAHEKPMEMTGGGQEISFMETKTLMKLLDNQGIRNVLSATEGIRPEIKLLIVAFGVIALMVVGYMIFVAPSSMSKDTCLSMVKIAKEGLVIAT